jgi:hypothetical protein
MMIVQAMNDKEWGEELSISGVSMALETMPSHVGFLPCNTVPFAGSIRRDLVELIQASNSHSAYHRTYRSFEVLREIHRRYPRQGTNDRKCEVGREGNPCCSFKDREIKLQTWNVR